MMQVVWLQDVFDDVKFLVAEVDVAVQDRFLFGQACVHVVYLGSVDVVCFSAALGVKLDFGKCGQQSLGDALYDEIDSSGSDGGSFGMSLVVVYLAVDVVSIFLVDVFSV